MGGWTVSAGGGRVVVCGGGRGAVRDEGGAWAEVGGGDVGAVAGAALSPSGSVLALLAKGGAELHAHVGDARHSWTLRRAGRRVLAGELHVAVADREGAAHCVRATEPDQQPHQLAGHLGALLALQLAPGHAFTCDRDEKIRVCRFPRTRDVVSYCLGHDEFVNGLEILPHDPRCLISSSGDGTVKLWDYSVGKEILSIDVCKNASIDDTTQFQVEMKARGFDIERLPIKKIACVKTGKDSSLLAVSLYGSRRLYLYKILGQYPNVVGEFIREVPLDANLADVATDKEKLWILFPDKGGILQEWKLSNSEGAEFIQTIHLNEFKFDEGKRIQEEIEELTFLFKRKIDNICEYRERKRKRLEIFPG